MLGDMTTSPLAHVQPADDLARLRKLAAGLDQARLRELIAYAEQSARDRARVDAVFFAALRQIANEVERHG
jgi:hydroxypyruvate isomerase